MKKRARDLGIPFAGKCGACNAITDVPGVEVGHFTIISDEHLRSDGTGSVRTGVTVVHPRGRTGQGGVAAGRATLNGTGEWTGMHLVDELGRFFGPIALTGTGNLGVVHQSLVAWSAGLDFLSDEDRYMRLLAVVGETLDAELHDVFGYRLAAEQVFSALDSATGGAVAEGNVGGGTGMCAYEFKGGIGTASRVIETPRGSFTVGALVQTNHARRGDLVIAGVPVGAEIADILPDQVNADGGISDARRDEGVKNSLLIVLATDAPLMPHQLTRLARRGILAVGRNGSTANNMSGELVLAFSTSELMAGNSIDDMDTDTMSALFAAAVQATEEAIINQLAASVDMIGNGRKIVYAMPHDRVVAALAARGRLVT